MWQHRGQKRPDFALEPGPDQESVWDYPRPPVLVESDERIDVGDEATRVATTTRSLRILETASPPTYYLPAAAVTWDLLEEIDQSSFCEWKGRASYYALAGSASRTAIAWRYRDPSPPFSAIHDHVSFYPGRIPCFVEGERVQPQPGEFYGGWITARVVGPFKGEPGTGHW